MIFDTLNNLPNYLGISPNLDTAIEFIMARDIAALPEGVTRLDGGAVTAEVRTLTPQSGDKLDFACSDGCLTLLTDLAGSEMFEVSLGAFAVKKPAAGETPAFGSAPPARRGCSARGGSPSSSRGSRTRRGSRPRAAARCGRRPSASPSTRAGQSRTPGTEPARHPLL